MDIKKKTKMVMNVPTLIYNFHDTYQTHDNYSLSEANIFMNYFPVIDFFN